MFVFKWETRRTFSQHGNNFWRVLYGAKSAQQNLDRKTKTLATDCIIVYKRSVLRRQSRDTNRNMKRLVYFRKKTKRLSPPLFLSDEGPTLETLDFTIRIGSTPTFSYFDNRVLYVVEPSKWHFVPSPKGGIFPGYRNSFLLCQGQLWRTF